jgi:hypothetical protein
MGPELENKRMIALLKKSPGESERFYAEKLNIDPGEVGPVIWWNEPIADPSLKFKASPASLKKARTPKKDGGLGLRVERVVARTGKSVSELEEISPGWRDIYSGRGRMVGNGNGNGGSKKATSGRRQSSNKGGKSTGTSGRRQAAAKGKAQPGKGRARTRAERLAKSGNPK